MLPSILVLLFAILCPITCRADTEFWNSSEKLKLHIGPNAMTALRTRPRNYIEAGFQQGASARGEIGLHLKGNYGTFQGLEGKPSFTLDFSRFRSSQKVHNDEKVHLNNSLSDPSFMSEALCHELFAKAHLPALNTSHALVELNGHPLGLYVVVQGYGKGFLKEYFAAYGGNLYDSEFRHDITEPLRKSSGRGLDDHSDLAILAKAAQESDAHVRIRSLAAVLNLDQFYSFLALELMVCHFDGYARSINNYWLYHDPGSEKFVFLPYGMDQMFWDPEGSLFPDLQGLVARAVLGTAEGRKDYRVRCKRLFSLFPPLTNRIEELNLKLRPEMAKDGTNALARFDHAVQELRDRVNKRISHLHRHLFAPDPSLLDLKSDEQTLVSNWLWSIEAGTAKMTNSATGLTVLRSRFDNLEKSSVATWEARLLLPKGAYLIVARTASDEPVFRGPNPPAGLKLWGGVDLGAQTVRIGAQHLDLLHPFRIEADQEEVLLQIQLRSSGQPVTFEVSPVIIRRLPD